MSDTLATATLDRPAVAGQALRPSGIQLLIEVCREAMFGLARNRFRAGLAMLGISWGIVSVVMLLWYGNGFRDALSAGFRNAFGSGVVISWPGQTSMGAGGERAGRRVRVTVAQALQVGELPLVKHVSPELFQELPVSYGNKQSSIWFARWRHRMARCAARFRCRAAASSTTRTCACIGAWRSSAPK